MTTRTTNPQRRTDVLQRINCVATCSANSGLSDILPADDLGLWHTDLKSLLFPARFELVPNTTEVFEWQLARMESKILSPQELIARGAYFSRINDQETIHYRLCLSNTLATRKGKSLAAKSHFKAKQFSAGYGVDGLFPYRGKFHAQLAKALLNVMGLKPGDLLCDPMAGSSTACLEARMMGINSIGFDISPFCTLMSEAKRLAMDIDPALLAAALADQNQFLELMESPRAITLLPGFVTSALDTAAVVDSGTWGGAVCKLLQLAYLDATGYARRRTSKTVRDVFGEVFSRYLATITNFRRNAVSLSLQFAEAKFETASALALPLQSESVDGVLTSPPYSFAIDYAENDRPQLEFLGHDVENLKRQMVGLRGGTKPEKVAQYFADLRTVLTEIFRVLKPGRMCVVIIGSNDIQTGGIRHEVEIKKAAGEIGFEFQKQILKPIKGMWNTMQEEFILFFQKPPSGAKHVTTLISLQNLN